MEKKTKKILAKEFLFLVVVLLVVTIGFLSIYPYNYYFSRTVDKRKEILYAKKVAWESLDYTYQIKKHNQNRIFAKCTYAKWDMDSMETPEKCWNFFLNLYGENGVTFNNKADGLEGRELLKEIGLGTEADFNNYIMENKFSIVDEMNHEKSDSLVYVGYRFSFETDNLSKKIFTSEQQVDFAYKISIILLLLLFPIRYLVLGTIWSIKTINQK